MPVVKPDRLVPLQSEEKYDAMYYVGSNEKYHYFECSGLPLGQGYRVARGDLNMPEEFKKGNGRSQMMWPGTLERLMAGDAHPTEDRR